MKKAYLIGGEVFSFNGGLAAIAGLLLYVPLRTARWSNRPRPCDVPIRVFDKFLVSPLRAMASSPDLSGNELSRDRSSRNDHRPQVPAARLSRLTVRSGSHERSFADTNTDTFLNQISPYAVRDGVYSKLNTFLITTPEKHCSSKVECRKNNDSVGGGNFVSAWSRIGASHSSASTHRCNFFLSVLLFSDDLPTARDG